MVLCFGEPPVRFLLLLFIHFCSSFCCHFCSSFCCCCFSFHFLATLPCHRHSTLASQAREDLHQLWALPQLLLIAFVFSSTASATVLSGRFLPTDVFCLTLLHQQPAFIKASLGAGSSSLKFAGLYTDPRNAGPADIFRTIQF